MSSTTHITCYKCGSSNKNQPSYECALCTFWTHRNCGNHLKYVKEIDLDVCKNCSSSIGFQYESTEKYKIFLLRALHKQLQQVSNIQLSGNEALHEDIDGLRGEIKEGSLALLHQLEALKAGDTRVPGSDQDLNQEGKNIQEIIGKMEEGIEAQSKNIESMHTLMDNQNTILADSVKTQNKMAEAQNAMLAEAVATQNKSTDLLAVSVASLNKFAEMQNSLLGECVVSLNKMIEVQNHQQKELLAESVATQKKLLEVLEKQQTPPPQDSASARVAQMEAAIVKMQEQFTVLLDNLKHE